jgi:hypothetical protein
MTIKINVDLEAARGIAAQLGGLARQCIHPLIEDVERLYAEAVNAKQAEESMGRMATGAELQALREWIDREFKSARDDIRLDSRLAEVESKIRVHLQGHQLSARGGGSSLEESRVDRILHDHERQKEAFLAMQRRLDEAEDLAKRIADRQVKGEQAVGGRLGDLERFRDGLGEVLEQRISRAQCEVIDYASESSKAVRRDVGACIDLIEQALGGAGAEGGLTVEAEINHLADMVRRLDNRSADAQEWMRKMSGDVAALQASHAQRDAWIARAEAHDLNKIEESIEGLDTRMGAVEARLTPDPDQMPRINIQRIEINGTDPDAWVERMVEAMKKEADKR